MHSKPRLFRAWICRNRGPHASLSICISAGKSIFGDGYYFTVHSALLAFSVGFKIETKSIELTGFKEY